MAQKTDEKTNGEGRSHHSIQGSGRVGREPPRVINQAPVCVEEMRGNGGETGGGGGGWWSGAGEKAAGCPLPKPATGLDPPLLWGGVPSAQRKADLFIQERAEGFLGSMLPEAYLSSHPTPHIALGDGSRQSCGPPPPGGSERQKVEQNVVTGPVQRVDRGPNRWPGGPLGKE